MIDAQGHEAIMIAWCRLNLVESWNFIVELDFAEEVETKEWK